MGKKLTPGREIVIRARMQAALLVVLEVNLCSGWPDSWVEGALQ